MMGRLQGKRMLCAIFFYLKSWTPPYLFAPNSKDEGLQHIIERKKRNAVDRNSNSIGEETETKTLFFLKNFDGIFFPLMVCMQVLIISKHFCLYACVHDRVTVFCCLHI